MEDSFFGFDTSLPLDDGGRIEEPSEEEYDALNDETFGSAVNGDWEEVHENLVRLTDDHQQQNTVSAAKGPYGPKPGETSSGSSTPMALIDHRLMRGNKLTDSDLELNLSSMKLDDVELCDDDESVSGGLNERIDLDPSVWTSQPLRPNNNNIETHKVTRNLLIELGNNKSHPEAINQMDYLRGNFPNIFQQQQILHPSKIPMGYGQSPSVVKNTQPPKICTLEDIERNIIIEQAMHKQQQQTNTAQQHQQNFLNMMRQSSKPATPVQHFQQHQQEPHQSHQQHHQQQQQQQQGLLKPQPILAQKGPPGFVAPQSPTRSGNNFANNLAQHLLQQQQQQHQQPQQQTGNGRFPPGFSLCPPGILPGPPPSQGGGIPGLPPHPLLNQAGIPPNFPHPHQRPLVNSHLPVALNNFAMHPNFSVMQRAAAVVNMQSGLLVPPQPPLRLPPPAAASYMYNMRLLQEIQQNHPMLQRQGHPMQQQNNGPHYNQQRGGDGGKSQNRRNGNLPPEEYDEYANLMSTRDKHWLIGIQLSQLNTDTPYIDDYYFTVYKERKIANSGNMGLSKAHKDNRLNHPLTQPKGHAQLVLVQLGNKNGTRNGQNRERRNSEAANGGNNSGGSGGGNNGQEQQKMPYVFTPLKFENSLGKLQYGSVTAPRKIIDAEIMSGESAVNSEGSKANDSGASGGGIGGVVGGKKAPSNGTVPGDITSSGQRKSRYILLHIETLYRYVLKLEDLDNPNAIATIIMKKKKESERIAALEQMENANKTAEEREAEAASGQTNPQLKNKFAYEIEPREALVAKLISGLAQDKIIAMMNVRKGKILLRRLMPYIEDQDARWTVWFGIFSSLPAVVKKDPEDSEGLLYALYPAFKKQIHKANFDTVVMLASSLILNGKKSTDIFAVTFGSSSLVSLILRAEEIYKFGNDDKTLTEINKDKWGQFLDHVASALNRTIQNHTVCATIESDSIQPMMNHFARFEHLKLDSLKALISQAKKLIN